MTCEENILELVPYGTLVDRRVVARRVAFVRHSPETSATTHTFRIHQVNNVIRNMIRRGVLRVKNHHWIERVLPSDCPRHLRDLRKAKQTQELGQPAPGGPER